MAFKTPYTSQPAKGEANSGELITEQAGYQPANVKIMQMIEAGERLALARRGYEFDEDEEVPDDYYDPTRDQNFDPTDAEVIAQQALGNLTAQSIKAAETPKTPEEVPKAALPADLA